MNQDKPIDTILPAIVKANAHILKAWREYMDWKYASWHDTTDASFIAKVDDKSTTSKAPRLPNDTMDNPTK